MAVDATDPVERLRWVATWFTAGLQHVFQSWKKPFNPILGETWQARRHSWSFRATLPSALITRSGVSIAFYHWLLPLRMPSGWRPLDPSAPFPALVFEPACRRFVLACSACATLPGPQRSKGLTC